MISRQWRGLAKHAFAEAYIEHLGSETFPAIRRLPGLVSASILRRDHPRGVEFLIVTEWVSIESVRGFAGSNPDLAVVPDKVREMMVEYDTTVRHYEVVE
jgi:heme-degrading monooxygenase HmoA